MQTYTLTDNQKELLKWFVGEVRAGNLDGDDFLIGWDYEGVGLGEYTGTGDIPEIKKPVLEALEKNDCLICCEKSTNYRCALTSRAYQAVDSNFDASDLSALPHLIPLTKVEHLDSQLWDRCCFSLSAGGTDPKAWDTAVRTATVLLEQRLRKLGKTEAIKPDATGEAIVNLIFGKDAAVLRGKLDDKKRQAYRDLYAGIMSVFRNQYAHTIVDPSPETGGAIIAFIDLLLKMLEDIDWDASEVKT
jgi:hypothetical protein